LKACVRSSQTDEVQTEQKKTSRRQGAEGEPRKEWKGGGNWGGDVETKTKNANHQSEAKNYGPGESGITERNWGVGRDCPKARRQATGGQSIETRKKVGVGLDGQVWGVTGEMGVWEEPRR